MDATESQRMGRNQKEVLDREVRKFRRRRLVKYHELEQDLLREVKIEKFLKGSLDVIPSPSPSVKIQIMGG